MPHPRMAQSQAERSPLYLFHSTGEESPGWTFSSPRIVGCILGALLCLAPWGFPRNLWSSTTGNLIVMGKGVGLATTSTWISADGVPTCRAQVVIQTSSYAHLQNRVSVVQPDEGTEQGARLPDSGLKMKDLPVLEPHPPCRRQGS